MPQREGGRRLRSQLSPVRTGHIRIYLYISMRYERKPLSFLSPKTRGGGRFFPASRSSFP